MYSPFENTDRAFEIFFDQKIVSIHKKNGQNKKATVDCGIFEDVTDQPIIDDAMETSSKSFNIITNDNCFVSSLSRGDELTTFDNRKFVIKSVVKDELFGVVIKARSK